MECSINNGIKRKIGYNKMQELYLNYLKNGILHYTNEDKFIHVFNRFPLQRDITFKYCLDHINNITGNKVILELGTSRSFTDGRFPGCNSDDITYWEPNNPEKWDWSAGCFTTFFSKLTDENTHITTVDIVKTHIDRCKYMTNDCKNKINYVINSSENVLNSISPKSVDLLYLDTGDMTPIEPTAELHLREAKIIVERNLLTDNGLILIDDVRNCTPKLNGETSDYGKAKYSIPYFIENGYEIVIDEYQVILQKKQHKNT